MKSRIGVPKLLLLVAMSVFGLWAALMEVVIYNVLRQSLPGCAAGPSGGIGFDCGAVLGSRYSQVFGIPLDLLAVGYFIVNLLLVYTVAFGGASIFRKGLETLFIWRFIGLAIVPYLVFVELVLVREVCLYCTIMHAAIIADFVIITYFLFYRKDSLYAQVNAEEEGGER